MITAARASHGSVTQVKLLVYENLPLGTTDATVIAVCERLRLTEVASLDRHHFSVIRPRHVERLRLLPD